MRPYILACIICIGTLYANAQSYQWTWIHGDTSGYQKGIYGLMGVSATSNIPGAREQGSVWKDLSGNLWLFGGFGYGETGNNFTTGRLNDLWKYNPATNEWTWIKGAKQVDPPSIYGTKGVAGPNNQPGGRETGLTWIDNAGNLWLFGGFNASGTYNSLWKFDISTNQWTWMHGDQSTSPKGFYGVKGVASPLNKPKGRMGGVSWKDAAGNFWLFGGWGDTALNQGGRLNDLWKYDITTNLWTWMKGDSTVENASVWGSKGQAAQENTPGSRIHAVSWTDNNGIFWLYGGEGGMYLPNGTYINEWYSDLWKYDPSTNNWVWVNGDIPMLGSSDITPGPRMRSTGAVDSNGDLWLFGGSGASGGGCCFLNNLWKYNIASNQWVQIRGSSWGDPPGEYGVKGVASASNDPYGLSGPYSWFDNSGNFLVFAGSSKTPAITYPPPKYNTLLKLTVVPLPVKLIAFTGKLQEQKATLNWTAENEINLDRYELERSVNARDFVRVGLITANGAKQYSYNNDLSNLSAAVYYYRLKMVNRDGSFEYSFIVPLKTASQKPEVYPNPAKNSIRFITGRTLSGRSELMITDAVGRIVLRQVLHSIANGTSVSFNLPPGTYLLRICNNENVYNQKLVVE